ncbi:MAG: peptidoglycan-binding domain-containing protein [Patescibacteria group bacterium]|nr:peptidoglycan-binding domain-containing protein [Patescibacteria group bacterium]
MANKKNIFYKFNVIIQGAVISAIFLGPILWPQLVTADVTTTATTSLPFDLKLATLKSGDLVKGSGTEVYVLSENNMLRWIPDEVTFKALDFKWGNIVTVTDEALTKYLIGDPMVTSTPALPTLAETEAKVRAYFIETPVMITVAKCESGFRQYNNDGTPLLGHGLYIGVFQIAAKVHADFAKSLGMDIYTLDGNMAYAKYLYGQLGTRPWAGCVKGSAPVASSNLLTLNLKLGDTNSQVKILQQLLNKSGFIIAKSGPGAVGNETEYFGSLTRAAVQRFQCEKNIVCQGSEATTGYGQTGPQTRTALLAATK